MTNTEANEYLSSITPSDDPWLAGKVIRARFVYNDICEAAGYVKNLSGLRDEVMKEFNDGKTVTYIARHLKISIRIVIEIIDSNRGELMF